MPTTSAARIANDSPFCEAHVAMDKVIERLMAMADEGATADDVSQLLAKDGTALLRDLMQGYVDRRAEQERRVTVVGADGIERAEARASSRRIETPVGEIEVKRLLYQAPGVEGLSPLDAALGPPDEKYTHDVRRIVAEESAKSSFDEVVELLEKRTGAHAPKRERAAQCAGGDRRRVRRGNACRTAWAAPARVGRSLGPKRSFGFARCARAATSMPTGSFTSRRTTSGHTAHATPTARFPLPPSRSHLKLVK